MMFARITLAVTAALATSAVAAAPRSKPRPAPARPPIPNPQSSIRNPIMPVSEVRAGMKGYGLTVFKGTKIERFGFEVLGLLPKSYMGQPLILVRLTGGPITARGAFLIQGMSGSPCYVNGRLIGAFSMGQSAAKEPIGMLTPIEPMLEALDPKLPNRPLGISAAEFGVGDDPAAAAAGGGSLSAFGSVTSPYLLPPTASLTSDLGPLSAGLGGLQFEPLAMPVMVSGLGGRAFRMLSDGLRPFRLAASPGPGAMKNYPKPIALQPGSAVGVQLMSGDVVMTAVGTVTYRRGNQLVAFGHPFLQIGPSNFPMTTAYVHEVFPGLLISHKIASPVKTVGALIQDRPFSVAGRLGPVPPMIPLTCHVDDRSTGRKRTFKAKVVNHPLLAPMLIPAAVNQAIYEVHPVPGDATAEVTTEVTTEGFGTIRRENQVFDSMAIDMAALEDLSQVLNVLSRNQFQRVPVKELTVTVTIEAKRRTASVERIFVRQEKFEPGETVEVGVVLRPYRGEPFSTTAQIKVPEYASNGRAVLLVSGGPARLGVPGVVTVGGAGGSSGGGAPPMLPGGGPSATSVTQLLQQYLEKEKNNQLVTRIVFATPAVNVAGSRLAQLPSTLVDVMRSSRTSGLRMDRDEVKSIQDTDWLVGGAQSLPITIERKDQSEKRTVESGTAKPSGSSSGVEVTTPGAAGATSLSADEEELEAGPVGPAGLEPVSSLPQATAERKPERRQSRNDRSSNRSRTGQAEKSSAETEAGGDTAKADDTSPDAKLVGRAASRWTQTSQADFERGTMNAVGVSSNGEIRLAPRLRALHETTEQYVWSVATGDGVAYAGTGNGGLVYRMKPDGDASVFFKTGDLQVHALARDRQGNLFAGTSPNGKVFRISPSGEGKLLFAVNPDGEPLRVPAPPARFVLSLAVAEDGTVYVGTGPEGRIYRITPDGKSSLFYQTPDQYVMSLLAVGERLYAGTANSGLVYEISRAGEATCIYDSEEKAITSLARDGAGRLYAASAPKGIIYRIAPGEPTPVWDKSKGAVYALAATGAGELYAACGNVIYRIGEDKKVTVLSDGKRAQFVALAVDGAGKLFAGSANVGTLYALEAASTGTFESAVHDAKTVARWGQVRWLASTPDGSRLQFETRTGNTPEPDATWSAWAPVSESTSGIHVTSPAARFIQYRVTLGGDRGTPVLRQVVISYLPRNQAPTVALNAPAAGEFWRGKSQIKWTGKDPDKDTLIYEVYFSGDNGKSWKRIGERVQAPPKPEPKPANPAAQQTAAPPAPSRGVTTNSALARFREDVASSAELSDDDRREALQQADELIARMQSEEVPPAPPEAVSGPSTAGDDTPADAGTTRESSLQWDTTRVPDGTYQIKVVASDRVSNPSEPQTDEVISDPVVVANQAPRVLSFTHSTKVGTDRKALVAGIAEARVPIQGAQYRIDGGDWTALVSSDGIWDGRFEPWSLTTPALRTGKHQLELKLVDVAGNVASKTVSIAVP